MITDKELIIRNGDAGQLAKRLGYSFQRVQNWKTRGIPAGEKLKHPDIFLTGENSSAVKNTPP